MRCLGKRRVLVGRIHAHRVVHRLPLTEGQSHRHDRAGETASAQGWRQPRPLESRVGLGIEIVETQQLVALQQGVGVQVLAASQDARSAGPWKSSRASARASNVSTGRAWIWAVLASLKGPQRRLRRRRVTAASPS
jgi:hypothetical protein